jgi:cytidine deaminase
MYEGKYSNLYDFLTGKEEKVAIVKLTVLDIEEVLGFKLPDAAFKYMTAWWANDPEHTQAGAWLDAGWKAYPQKDGKTIAFMRDKKKPKLDQPLVDAAIELLKRRFPGKGGTASAMYTESGEILTSVNFQPEWGGGGLCAETGAMLEANNHLKKIVATVSVSRLSATDPIVIVAPCGICQERFFHWGYEVQIAVPQAGDGAKWEAKTLGELQPYHWVKSFQ